MANIARRLNISPSSVLLKWSIMQGVCVIPRSSNKEHIEENIKAANFDLIKLTEDDMSILNSVADLISNPKYKSSL